MRLLVHSFYLAVQIKYPLIKRRMSNCDQCQEKIRQGFFIECCAIDPSLEELSRRIKGLPVPLHAIGDIVIVPPGSYGVVQFVAPDMDQDPPQGWVYCVVSAGNLDNYHYYQEQFVVKAEHFSAEKFPTTLYISPDENDGYKINTDPPACPHRVYAMQKSDLLAQKYLHQKTVETPKFESRNPGYEVYIERDIAGDYFIV